MLFAHFLASYAQRQGPRTSPGIHPLHDDLVLLALHHVVGEHGVEIGDRSRQHDPVGAKFMVSYLKKKARKGERKKIRTIHRQTQGPDDSASSKWGWKLDNFHSQTAAWLLNSSFGIQESLDFSPRTATCSHKSSVFNCTQASRISDSTSRSCRRYTIFNSLPNDTGLCADYFSLSVQSFFPPHFQPNLTHTGLRLCRTVLFPPLKQDFPSWASFCWAKWAGTAGLVLSRSSEKLFSSDLQKASSPFSCLGSLLSKISFACGVFTVPSSTLNVPLDPELTPSKHNLLGIWKAKFLMY